MLRPQDAALPCLASCKTLRQNDAPGVPSSSLPWSVTKLVARTSSSGMNRLHRMADDSSDSVPVPGPGPVAHQMRREGSPRVPQGTRAPLRELRPTTNWSTRQHWVPAASYRQRAPAPCELPRTWRRARRPRPSPSPSPILAPGTRRPPHQIPPPAAQASSACAP